MKYEEIQGKTIDETIAYIGTQARALEKGCYIKNLAKAIVRLKRDSEADDLGNITDFCAKKYGFDARRGAFQALYEAIRIWEAILDEKVPASESKFDTVAVSNLTQLSAVLVMKEYEPIREEAITAFCEEKKPLSKIMELKKSVKPKGKGKDKPKGKENSKPSGTTPPDGGTPKGKDESEVSEISDSGAPTLDLVTTPEPTPETSEEVAAEIDPDSIIIPPDKPAFTQELAKRISADIIYNAENGKLDELEALQNSLTHLAKMAEDAVNHLLQPAAKTA